VRATNKQAGDIVIELLEHGMTQQQIGASVNLHQTTVSKLARGDVADVMSNTLKKLEALHAQTFPQKTGA
jgi:transcriptional regulator with XRE-family HTH domain